MNRLLKILIIVSCLFAGSVTSEVPQLINYQGRLDGPSGSPISGVFSITFSIYSSDTAIVAEWSESHLSVVISKGLFEVLLGSIVPIEDSVFQGPDNFLGIKVGLGTEMVPRIRLTSVPFAFQALRADTADVAMSTSAGGWVDDGTVVRLINRLDSVGIGTATPSQKLDVEGKIHASGGISVGDMVFPQYYKLDVVGVDQEWAAIRGNSIKGDGTGTGGEFQGGDIGLEASATGNGVFHYGANCWAINGSFNYGVYTFAGGGGMSYGIYATASGATGSTFAGYFQGDVQITGLLTGGTSATKIDHPLDPANKYLYHAFVESPDMMNIYNGNVSTDETGEAFVVLPDYFSALNRDFRYQLTVIGQFAQAIVFKKITGNQFSIRTDKPYVEVSWQVTGVRIDAVAEANRVEVEVDKPSSEKGKYLNPSAFGLGDERGLNYEIEVEQLKKRSKRESKKEK